MPASGACGYARGMRETLHVHHCRAGFEKECAAELSDLASRAGIAGHVRAAPGSALCMFAQSATRDAGRAAGELAAARMVFSRQGFVSPGLLDALPGDDRIPPIIEAVRALPAPFDSLLVEHPDTEEGRRLARFCRSFARPLGAALRDAALLAGEPAESVPRRLHLLFLDSSRVYPGCSRAGASSPWPMGIPRLKLPRGAPSRSALKLEEALLVMVPPAIRERRLRPGMSAVDLGASPGGWSFVLARHGLQVTAVDNGPIDRRIADDLSVEHRREDGFHFRPARPVDWLTCDMAASPVPIATLLARWFAEGLCRAAVFNLKLPMRKRYQVLRDCDRLIRDALGGGGFAYELRFKHLYHDREEVTGCFLRAD